MKISTKKEIEEFINRQIQLADNQIVTLSVNPEHVFGGEQGGSVNQKCKNRQAGCQISTNEKNCTNYQTGSCSGATNTGICNNK